MKPSASGRTAASGGGTTATAAGSSSQSASLRLVGQQSQYLAHLKKQMVRLRDHTGAFGPLQLELEDRKEQAAGMKHQLHETEEALAHSQRAGVTKEVGEPEPEPADLEGMANNLEILARRIKEMEGLADAQGAGLRQDLARVMEVFDDPGAFLPTPLKPSPFDLPAASPSPAPASTSAPTRSKEGRQTRFSPSLSANLTSPLPLHESTNRMRGPRAGAFEPELETVSFGPPLFQPSPEPSTGDPLDEFRASVARQVHSWRTSKEVADSAEEIRRLGKEATSNSQAVARLNALTNQSDPRAKMGRSKKGAEVEQPVAARPPPRPKQVKPMQNSELYPWTSQLQEIFKGVRTSDGPLMPPVQSQVLGGLAQSIPAYLEYQAYVQAQILAQERERQDREAQRLAEEKQAQDEEATLAAAALRRARATKISALPTPLQSSHQPTPVFEPVPPLALAPIQQQVHRVSASIQTSPRTGRPMTERPMVDVEQHALLQMDGHPPPEVFGQRIPRFDAAWDAQPSPRNAPSGTASRAMSPRRPIHPSLPSSPRQHPLSPRSSISHATHGQYPIDDGNAQHSEAISRMGSGQPVPPISRKSALSVLEQAALDLQYNAKVRGEGVSSNRALESLLESAHPQGRLAHAHDSENESLSVPPHPLFSNTPSQQLSNYPNSGLLSLVLQMYDMPTELQVSREWKRVLGEEEEREERRKQEAEDALQQPPEVLHQPQEQPEEKNDEPQQLTSPVPANLAAEQAARADDQEQARQREQALDAARQAAEAETARLAAELQQLKEQTAAAALAAATAAPISTPAPISAPAPAPTLLMPQQMEEQRAIWEADARRRLLIEQEAARHAVAQATADAVAAEQQRARDAAARAKEEAAQAVEAELACSRPAQVADPAVAGEVDRIRQMQASEQSLLDLVRAEEASRWAKELERREEERQKLAEQHDADEARYVARRAEREAEEARRRELERRRDELLQKKMELEAERTKNQMEALRADLERLRAQKAEPPQIPVSFLNRTPLSTYKPGRMTETSEEDSSWTSSSELGNTCGNETGRFDLSEGEVDLRGATSPGLLAPPRHTMPLKPSSRAKLPTRHSASVLHPPIHSATPLRPGQRPSTAEQKYPHSTEYGGPRDSDLTHTSLDSLHSTTREDIAAMLREGQSAEATPERFQIPLRTEYNVPYSSAVSSVKQALAAPSRTVLLGHASPPLVDPDVSRLVRDSLDGSSNDIGGLFGLGLDGRPTSSGSTLSEPRELEADSLADFSFGNSPKQSGETDTERWLRSIRG